MSQRKDINEGPAVPERRRGELVADDLLAIVVEDGGTLQVPDVQALAMACDVPLAALGLGEELPVVSVSSP
jgi:hypothetical protein